MKQKPIPSTQYTENYYLHSCGGHDLYSFENFKELGIINKKIVGTIKVNGGEKILEIGCGRGELLYHYLMQGCQVTGIDYSGDSIKLCGEMIKKVPMEMKNKISLKQMDAKEMCFDQNEFDFIFCSNVVEHLYDWELDIVLNKCRNILKSDGKLIIYTNPTINYIKYGQWFNLIWSFIAKRKVVKIINFEDEKHESYHVNIQSKQKLKEILERNGFRSDVWYDFIEDNNFIKVALKQLRLVSYISHSIFAIAD